MAHPFSQRANERLGARACGVNLGLVGGTVELKGIALGDTVQRTSLMLYFQPLTDSAARHVYVPEPHRAMLARTYAGCGMDVTFGSAATTLTGDSEVSATYVGGLDFGMIGVRSVGADIAVALRAARRGRSLRARDSGLHRGRPDARGAGRGDGRGLTVSVRDQRARSPCATSAALVHGTRQTLHAVHQLRGRIVRKTQAHGLCEAEAADEP